jgi:hypothetical protein
VVLAEEIAGFVQEKGYAVTVTHRDVDRSPVGR